MNSTSPELRTKGHYQVLDGLRGVAAVVVVVFHTLETYTNGNPLVQIINHGYLAVDFFFLLSGFVVAYAYDDRWERMSEWEFYKRRLIRLQPMVVFGSLLGAAFLYLGKSPVFPLIAHAPLGKVVGVAVLGCLMIPVTPGAADVRGWDESYPLNGPAWSLMFEYVANVLYAVGIRRCSKKVLGALLVLAAGLLVEVAVFGPEGGLRGGWSINAAQLHIGFARLLYPFLAGMLLMRMGLRIKVRGAFAWCSVLLVGAMALPRFGGTQHHWMNGLYEAVCVLVLFPVIVAMGAGHQTVSAGEARVCRALGDISYPLYITHYTWIYLYTAWVTKNRVPPGEGAVVGVGLLVVSLAVAYGALKVWDEPVRRLLGARFLRGR